MRKSDFLSQLKQERNIKNELIEEHNFDAFLDDFDHSRSRTPKIDHSLKDLENLLLERAHNLKIYHLNSSQNKENTHKESPYQKSKKINLKLSEEKGINSENLTINVTNDQIFVEEMGVNQKFIFNNEKAMIWKRLQDDRKAEKIQKELMRKQKEEDELKANCPFKPKILQNFMDNREPRRNVNKLYEDGIEKIRTRKSMQEYKEELTEDHTFKPCINKNIDISEERNFELRILENLKKKQENLIKLQEETSGKFSFQPKINRKSQNILNEREKKNCENSFSFKASTKENFQEDWSFKPIILNNPKYQINGDFFERAEQKNKEKQEKIMKINQDTFYENVTFQPKINKISLLLSENDPKRKNLNSFDRLHTNPNSKKEIIFEEYEEKFNKMHSFKPKLAKNPKDFIYSVENLYDENINKEKYQKKKNEIEENRLKECTFKPDINKKNNFYNVPGNYSDFSNIQKKISLENREKDIRVREKKKKEVEDNLKECTFEPHLISKNKPKSNIKSHLISGLERFYELKDLKEKKNVEKRKIEEKVFHHEKKYEKNKHYLATTPLPFNLSEKTKNCAK